MKTTIGRKWLPASTFFVCFIAVAAGLITINAADAAYRNLPNVRGTNIHTDAEIRIAAGWELTGAYRLKNGLNRLPQGSQFKVIWQDKSSEIYMISSRYLSMGTVPVPNTQQSAPSSSGGGGGIGGGIGGGDPDSPWANCYTTTVRACTSVGGGAKSCENFTSLVCPLG